MFPACSVKARNSNTRSSSF